MACCKVESGVPLLVTPNTSSRKDGDLGSFAAVVDRSLAHLREVLIAEHSRRLQMNGSFAGNTLVKPSWQIPAESQGSAFSVQPTWRTDAVTHPATDCGTQTQVDWHWPGMLLPWTTSGEVDNDRMDPSDDRALEIEICSMEVHPPRKTSANIEDRNFVSMKSEDLKAKNQEKADRIAKQVDTSAWQRIMVRSQKAPLEMIDGVMGFIIIANAIALGVSCDTKAWEKGWLIVDSIFAGLFVVELVIKVRFLGLTGYLWNDEAYWAWFETVLVILSVAEVLVVWISDASTLNGSSIFRVIRLVRLVKILRICRVPMAADLVMMVAGIMGGTRTLVSAILLVLFPLFVFALVMRETLGEEPAGPDGSLSFNTLPKACFNTFRCLVVDDCADETGRPIFVLVFEAYGWGYSFIYSVYLIVLKFGLYNVIVAIFVEQTVRAAKHNMIYQKRARLNDELMFQEKSLEMAELAYSLQKHIPVADVSCHLTLDEIERLELSRVEFNQLCKNADFKELLTALDVAEEDHLDLFDTLDVDNGGTLDLGEIVSGIGKLRGDARKSDVVAVILLAKHLSRSLTEFKEQTIDVLEAQKRQLMSIQKGLQPMFGAHARSMSQNHDGAP